MKQKEALPVLVPLEGLCTDCRGAGAVESAGTRRRLEAFWV